MYGSTDRSMPQRFLILILECIFLLIAFWLLFMEGNEFFHLPEGDLTRNIVLFVCCIITFFRMNYMVFFLLRRGITWGEALNVPFAFALYFIGYSLLGGIVDKPIYWLDYFAIFLFLIGSVINSLSEILRDSWKKDKRNKGKLYTGGLFKYAVHINYFGDMVWVSGFALLTRNSWSIFIPIALFCLFVFYNIPVHDRYMRDKYGESFRQYEKGTKKFIPFIY
jgi:protein-S-isoprenylcysteine O-methyltransferase Ste14